MWTLKILLLAAGVTVTALTSQPSANAANCADASEAAIETTSGDAAATGGEQPECPVLG